MDTLPFPRQRRCADARSEPLGRCPDSAQGTTQPRAQARKVLRRSIGQRFLRVVPHELRRVQLGSVSRKTVHMEPLAQIQVIPHDLSPVSRASIPQYDHGTTKMTKQNPYECNYLHAGNILRIKPDEKPQTLSQGRYADATNDRNPISELMMAQDRSITNWRPCLPYVRDHEKSALVEEDEMGTKFCGFFLSGATRPPSSARWLPHPFPMRGAPAFASSTARSPLPSRHWLRRIVRRTPFRSVSQCVSASTRQSCNHGQEGLWPAIVPALGPALSTISPADPAWATAEAPSVRRGRIPVAIGRPSSRTYRGRQQPRGTFLRTSASRWRDACGAPAPHPFLGVSCPPLYHKNGSVSIT